jgi:hypothetical protein
MAASIALPIAVLCSGIRPATREACAVERVEHAGVFSVASIVRPP